MPEAFCWSWGALREFNRDYLTGQGETIFYTRSLFSLHSTARNMLAQQMRGDWLFMTDTDHVIEPDCVYKLVQLMQQYHVPVITGIYRHKEKPHHAMLWQWAGERDGFAQLTEVDMSAPLIQVDAAGAGCLLIHRCVFERLRTAFPNEAPFDHQGKFGEDFSFFKRCKEAGIPVYATPLVETLHLVPHAVTADDYIPEWYETEQVALAVPGLPEAVCPSLSPKV